MKIIIEEYQYPAEVVKDVLWEGAFHTVDGKVSVGYVGYYYSQRVKDCVFVLPKVLLEVVDGRELVFGKYRPEDVVDCGPKSVFTEHERSFIYGFAVWIYRAIRVYDGAHENNGIVYRQNVSMMGHGHRRIANSFLDIVLALIQFNIDNRDFFFFTVKNQRSGCNKINWTRTIAKTDACIGEEGVPVYISPVNKKRRINFDEELIVIFFSILDFIRREYGFPVEIGMGYELITGAKFGQYLRGAGRTRLKQIRYKYFSDTALYLWQLCYSFFDRASEITIDSKREEYLLAKNFNIVFEAIIDELVGDRRDELPAGLADQDDGKRVDHMYHYRALTDADEDHNVHYIGDSKYYKRGHDIGRESVYKQFTYARNVIQWNLNLFLDDPDERTKKDRAAFGKFGKLRDDVTEGYNIIPNFFISARLNKELNYNDEITVADNEKGAHISRQFENRLFDRDTLLVAHYDVNFLFVVSLYARNNAAQKAEWKTRIREIFRTAIQKMLSDKFEFYAMTPRADVDAESFFRDNFQMSLGKVYAPFGNKGKYSYYSLALDKDEKYKEENEIVFGKLSQGFHIAECPLGCSPETRLAGEEPVPTQIIPEQYLTQHWLENYPETYFLIGCYKDKEHHDWIFSRKGKDKRDDIYNVRIGKKREGGVVRTNAITRSPKFLVLYDFCEASSYKVYRIRNNAVINKERIERSGYVNPQGDYYCYILDEEVTLGKLDVPKLIADASVKDGYKPGMPLYVKGAELIQYRL